MAQTVVRLRGLLHNDRFLWFVLFGLFTKFCIVLVTYKPYTLAKLYLPLLLLLLALKVLADGRLREFLQVKYLSAWALFAVLAVPLGYLSNPHDWRLYTANLLSVASYVVLYTAALYVADSPRNRLRLLGWVLGFCVLGALYMCLQWLTKFTYTPGHVRGAEAVTRPYGIMDDPNYSAGLLLIGLALAAWFLLRPGLRGPLLRAGLVAGAGVCALALYASQSFAAWGSLVIGLSVGGLAWVLFAQRPTRPRTRFLFALSMCAGVLAVFLLFLWAYQANLAGLAQRIESVKFSNASDRIDSYRMALHMAAANPLFGIGPWNDFIPALNRAYGMEKFVIIHNTLLSMLANTGVLGLAALLWTLLLGLWQTVAPAGKRGVGLLGPGRIVVLGLLLAIQAQSYSLHMVTSIPFWFALMLPHLLPVDADPGAAPPANSVG